MIYLALYQLLFSFLILVYLLVLWPLRVINKKESPQRLHERLGLWWPSRDKYDLWLHAVSNGETLGLISVAQTLLKKHPNIKIVFTCNTLTAAHMIKSSVPEAKQVMMPLDHILCWALFYKRFRPKLLLIAESELWPCLISYSSRKMKVELISARLSDKSARRWSKYPSLLRYMVKEISSIHPQSDIDHHNWVKLLQPIKLDNKLLGQLNLKITSATKQNDKSAAHPYITQLAQSRPVWLAASTHEGEEKIILEAHKLLRSLIPGIITIILVRHPTRVNAVTQLISQENISYAVRTDSGQTLEMKPDNEVLLVATTGELKRFYASVKIAFVGGSLKPIGGHNIIEAIQEGCIPVVGPYNFNFSYITEVAANQGLTPVATDADSLSHIIHCYFTNDTNNLDSKFIELKQYLDTLTSTHQQELEMRISKWEEQLGLKNS